MTAGYGRVRDLLMLAELIVEHAGDDGLEHVLDQRGIPKPLLDEPDAVVPMRDIIGLYRDAAIVLGHRSFGLHSAKGLDMAEYGAMGEFVMSAPTLLAALKRFQKTLPCYESGSHLYLKLAGDELSVGYENDFQDMPGFRQAGDMTLRLIEGVIRGYLGDDWAPKRLETNYALGPSRQDYEDAFCAPILSGEDRIALVLDRGQLDNPAPPPRPMRSDEVASTEVRRMAKDLPTDLLGAVSSAVDRQVVGGDTSLGCVANSLSLSARTLQRRLAERGFVYRDLVLERRMQRARQMLQDSALKIDTIAETVGYSATSHFTRAFGNSHGTSPSEYRRTYLTARTADEGNPDATEKA